jgi:hypothetical protein
MNNKYINNIHIIIFVGDILYFLNVRAQLTYLKIMY